jgi:hypothetical protein
MRDGTARLIGVLLCAAVTAGACAGALVRPGVVSPGPRADALLVLPGFGYGPAGEKALRTLALSLAAEGIDLFVPKYIDRGGLSDSRDNLERFIREHRLYRYARLHVFAFIAGAWAFNPIAETRRLPNLTTVVYDRSPYQERAPRIADETLHFLTWLRYGSPVFDLARTPYPPMSVPGVKVALMIETRPTSFIRKREARARAYGPLHFECDALAQRHDDCLYLDMNHDELYVRFAEVWPDLLSFIRTGRFTSSADRTPPESDLLDDNRR